MLLALLTACASEGPRDDGSTSAGSFARVVNDSSATLVLVGPDEWLEDDEDGWDLDCDADVAIDLDGDALVISGNGDACTVRVRTGDVREVECDGDGDLDHDGDLRDISHITLNGNGSVRLHRLDTDVLDLDVGGNGFVAIDDLRAHLLRLDLTGSSDVQLGGIVAKAEMSITGNGNLDARELVLQDLIIDMTGSGTATVTVEHSIDGEIGGNGTLDVYGNPEGTVDVSGSGHLTFHDD
jgi:hypothetical protein